MKSLVVIGGGAAGLMAAASARKAFGDEPLNITVVEKNQRPARKVMITGKGRCNVTNNCDLDTLIKNTPRNGKFLYSAFSNLLPSDVMTLIESQGVPLKTERGNRVFPVSDKAGGHQHSSMVYMGTEALPAPRMMAAMQWENAINR